MPSRYDVILGLDPAGRSDCGVALRPVSFLPGSPFRGRLPAPTWTYQGSVWNSRMLDDLSVELHRYVAKSSRVLLAAEDCVFRSRKIARSVGRGIGCIESLLVALNVYDPAKDLLWAPERTWRTHHWPDKTARPSGRESWKQAAVELVQQLYGGEPGEDEAEAVLISDWAAVAKQALWSPKRRRAHG